MKHCKIVMLLMAASLVFSGIGYSEDGYKEIIPNGPVSPGGKIYTLENLNGYGFIAYYYQGMESDRLKIKHVRSGKREYFTLPVSARGEATLKTRGLPGKPGIKLLLMLVAGKRIEVEKY